MITTTYSEKQTFNLGKKIAKKLQGGKIIGLTGDLGAGKTVFIKGLTKGLSVRQAITSPTFVLMKIYPISNPCLRRQDKSKILNFCHIDAYRLSSGQDLIDVGVKDWLNQANTITVIEWAERVKDILPKNAIFVKIKFGKRKNQRTIEIK